MTRTDSKFCTFWLGDAFFGVPVAKVQEVICPQDMTRIPLAAGFIRGLINLRGQIVTAIDLRRRLGFQPRGNDEPPMNVVIRADGSAVSLLVDEIDEVFDATDETFEAPPENLDPAVRTLLVGVHKFPDRLMHVLDTHAVLTVPSTTRARDLQECET
ncbi:MAG: chemotaxis protein CheW [Planctomycetes bacterium]|nr:chemotaxis protein CheW [Planctomycetota bacterium]